MATKRNRQTPRLDESARDELGRGVLRGSVSRLETDPGVADRIVARLERGQSHRTAAQAEGVPHRTFYDWLERGRVHLAEGEDSAFARFASRVDSTVARVLGDLEAGIVAQETLGDESGRVDPAVAKNRQWLLERRLPEVYGKRIEHVVRVDAMEWLLAQLDAGVDAGRISPGARAEVLLYLADVQPGDEAAGAVH